MHNDKLDLILNELHGMKTDIQDIKTEQLTMKTDIQSIKTEQLTMKNDMQDMKTEIQGIKTELRKTNVELQVVKSEQQAMTSQINHRFDTLETQVAHIHEDVTGLKASVNRIDYYANEDVVAILKTIDSKLQDKDSRLSF